MKGKISVRFCMPNLGRFRSRVEAPPKELSKQLRDELTKIVSDTLNKSTLDIRAQFIAYVDSLNLSYKSATHELQVKSLINNYFDAVFASTEAELSALCDSTDESDEKSDEDSVDDTADEEPATGSAPPEAAHVADDFE